MIYEVPRIAGRCVGLNDRDARWHDLYKIRVSTAASNDAASNRPL
ncbi:MAG: hypothetical protein WKF30_14670 [Pyrinomonadaceae bacterium]